MIDTAFKTPSFFIIGWGKDYFGAEITATDNEHLYIALVYGPIIWLALIIVAFLAGFKYTILLLKTSNKNYLFKSSIILSWVIIAIPAAFITYPQALILSALFQIIMMNNKLFSFFFGNIGVFGIRFLYFIVFTFTLATSKK
ncbi:hypothetical protein [Providencia hangzhouensis]|uniref:hypothetical protein n=1 Tax=Providencia hangzhouensis TaxID=3031799 RepID=UPI0034DCF74F